MNEIVTDMDKLRDIALDQYGYVTTQQALKEGVSYASLSMMVKRGRLERECFGVYQVPQVTYTQFNRYMLAVLWTGAPETVLSHDTALDLYGVCDINPLAIHITIGKKHRINRNNRLNYIVHHQDLKKDQTSWVESLPVVTLAMAIEQCLETVPIYLLKQAVEVGTKRGLLLTEETDSLLGKIEENRG
ncbi:MAG: type IV toxin-antitoxin system AbiEi family antitoxin domain-containing protein [Eggerthellaceae bacterium]|jgi:predicted transcriptional regulator of viral defense system|nr:type IV toxin-antitoxin system AbiEi family antitoxin domain-containing protein [Eggerthellaceae bacterium]MCH4221363.1 type IV toxin-antitoxin system AbiEi family antitoxin domain-containing protein [Eggerthellaceae bacterium]